MTDTRDLRDLSSATAVVIGGGFYGARLALMLRAYGSHVTLVEREPVLLGRASLRNQARVHNGYHYPRSILTSLRSRMNYSRFLAEYAECVDRSFRHYYAVGRAMSKITAKQFVAFCGRIEAPVRPAPEHVAARFNASRIESVFQVEECAFDAARLRERVSRDLVDAGVTVMLRGDALRLTMRDHARATVVTVRRDDEMLELSADLVLNCTYSRVNHLLAASGAATIPLKHECTEMALIEPPPDMEGAAVTVMDGPFFSMMPYPSRGLFTLSHVRYTPHCSWIDRRGDRVVDGDATLARRTSRAMHMIRDAERYLPCLRSARQMDSLFEVKTVMPRSEKDDSRPILLRRSEEIPSLLNVLGAKIDSVYDVEDALEKEFAQRTLRGAMAVAV